MLNYYPDKNTGDEEIYTLYNSSIPELEHQKYLQKCTCYTRTKIYCTHSRPNNNIIENMQWNIMSGRLTKGQLYEETTDL